MAHSSKTAFARALAEYGLESLKDQFIKRGWETYSDFAFSTSDPSGKDPQAFQKEVVEEILAKDGKEKHLIPKLRRLYAQAYIFASKAMNDEAEPRGVEEKFHMHPADRSTRTEALRARITGWQLSDQNLPATTLVDKMATILQKDTVKYIAWNKCISKQQELVEEPEVKGLRITTDGLLLQDVAPDPTTPLSGEFLWDYALRRRACAGDIAGLMTFESAHAWQELLKTRFLMEPPPGHRRVSWAQIQAADTALWTAVALACENGTKAKKAGGKTAFEEAWILKMTDPIILSHLTFLPGPSQVSGPSGSSGTSAPVSLSPGPQSETNKLKRALEQANNRIRNLIRGKPGKGAGKKGKGKGRGKGKRAGRTPPDIGNFDSQTPDGRRICFGYNRPGGCPLAKPGAECSRGAHVCARCHGTHGEPVPCSG